MRRYLGVLLLLGCGACVDAPFEHANPNDRAWPGTVSLVFSRDTVWASEPGFVAQVVTDPLLNGYTPHWSVSGDLVLHEGDGVFRVTRTVPAVTPVQIYARFGGATASRIVYVVPNPSP